MIKVRLQIPKIGSDDGIIYNTESRFGLVYSSSDNIFSPPTKGFEQTSYPEQAGENTHAITVDAAFDYNVKFLICTDGGDMDSANKLIADFNSLLYNKVGDLKTFKRITFYNDYKKVKIVGIPQPIQSASKFWRDSNGQYGDAVEIEFVIRVDKPNLCNFNL